MMFRICRFFILISLIPGSIFSGDFPNRSDLKLFGNWEIGQFEQAYSTSGHNGKYEVDKDLINHATVWALQEARLSPNTKVYLGVGGAYFFVYPRNVGDNPYVNSKRSGFGLTDAHGEFTFFKRGEADYGLRVNAGIFGYKYNEDAKNLGEYMFRTWTYPTILYTGGLELVNSAGVQLSGLSAGSMIGGFKNDVLLTVQTERAPIFGLSLTDIVSYDIGGVLKLGAGFMFDNFYHPNKEDLEPKGVDGSLTQNSYYSLQNGDQMANQEYYDLYLRTQAYYIRDITTGNLIVNPDSITQFAQLGLAITDSGYYTFTGQKAVFRAALDFKKLVGGSILASGDPKLYFEAVVMGIKNYPTYYENIKDRTAFMSGLNLPTFGMLDMLSVEAEYSSNPFPNSTEGVYKQIGGPVLPFVDPTALFPNISKSKRDDWKWTVYAKKQIHDGFDIYVQLANDHVRQLDVFSAIENQEFMPNGNNWYWVVKLAYAI